ncbi:MAG: SMC-Scp complex subunit ScpB [Nanoarchaeota archaeon]|nr:SMC-Scp complex subunit ScpB [Nanoarchaeota archaeon]
MEQQTLESQIEALLFSYGDFLSIKELQTTLHEESELKIKEALKKVQKKFEQGFSFIIIDEGGRYKMKIREEFDTLASDLIANLEIPQHYLKVLSVIAYEQPVSKTRLAEIIGKNVQSEIAYLYRNKFLSYQKVGIGKFYRVTKKFYDYFQLEEDEDFRKTADSNITTFFQSVEDLAEELQITVEEAKHILEMKNKSKEETEEDTNEDDNSQNNTYEENQGLEEKFKEEIEVNEDTKEDEHIKKN